MFQYALHIYQCICVPFILNLLKSFINYFSLRFGVFFHRVALFNRIYVDVCYACSFVPDFHSDIGLHCRHCNIFVKQHRNDMYAHIYCRPCNIILLYITVFTGGTNSQTPSSHSFLMYRSCHILAYLNILQTFRWIWVPRFANLLITTALLYRNIPLGLLRDIYPHILVFVSSKRQRKGKNKKVELVKYKKEVYLSPPLPANFQPH
jgi:hypothetical protein